MIDIKTPQNNRTEKVMYYKNTELPYENIENSNIILGFPKYYKVEIDKFRLIDTYDMISVPIYNKLNTQKLFLIDKKEWDIIESIIKIAYKKRRGMRFND